MSSNNGQMGLDDFLTHDTGFGSGGGGWKKQLKNWKKENGGKIDVWLHTRGGLANVVWSHGWYDIVRRKDRDSGEELINIWSRMFNCHEEEAVLRGQYKLNQDGDRIDPPKVCPLCITIELIRRAIDSDRLKWTDPVFEWNAGGEKFVIHAGGVTNAFGKGAKMTDAEKADLRKHGIVLKDAWKENMRPRAAYIFRVVPDAEPEECKIATVAATLGDAMKAAIKAERTRVSRIKGANPDAANPLLNPYPFQWAYDEKNPNFGQRYSCIALSGAEPSPEVLHAITEGELPDIGDLIATGNCRKLRAQMEAHACIDLPWDKIFGPAEKAGLMDEPSGDEEGDASFDTEKLGAAAPEVGKAQDEPSEVVCEACGKTMPDDTVCPHCGATYETGHDDEGDFVFLAMRPCAKCKTLTETPEKQGGGEHGRSICPKCGTIHNKDWSVLEDPPAKSPPPRRGSKAVAAPAAPVEALKPEGKGKRSLNW